MAFLKRKRGTYAAAVKGGDISWKAWFFGASDPSSFMTVDQLPASLWLGGLVTRVFGFSSRTILLPQALAGVASVLILHHLVRRWQGDVAALLAALAFAVTPVAVAMFRLNAPDALLTLLLLGAAWARSLLPGPKLLRDSPSKPTLETLREANRPRPRSQKGSLSRSTGGL